MRTVAKIKLKGCEEMTVDVKPNSDWEKELMESLDGESPFVRVGEKGSFVALNKKGIQYIHVTNAEEE